MGNIARKIIRPLRNFNVENRAHRIISKDKPEMAPRYKMDAEHLQRILKDNPGLVEQFSKKDGNLDNRLKDVYVSSTDPKITPLKRDPKSRPLPVDRSTKKDNDFGIEMPENVEPGFINQAQLLKLLAEHRKDPELHTLVTAQKYALPKEAVDLFLKYYGAFNIIEPPANKKLKQPQNHLLYQQLTGAPTTLEELKKLPNTN